MRTKRPLQPGRITRFVTASSQLMGFDMRDGWKGWDTVEAQMPLSEMMDIIIDLRSLTQGVGTYEMAFDHLAELTGKLADHVVATHKVAA